ncbi:MAG: glycogen/starch/alpha-glucan family phosphorylase [Chlamydiia bacterium]|nr:glycogen/starch/alpha-glucan family phosphorylase [Chlamydiia bacterium]
MDPIDIQAETVAQKVRHYLITMIGRPADEANDEEFYRAFVTSLREEIMINWTATDQTLRKKGVRKLYYLSLEYMPGRLFGNNISNISAMDFIQRILKRLNRNYVTIANMEHDIGIGNGGLGRLASCFMDSLATLHYPAMGYGMRYQYGIFDQELICGVQVERPDTWLLTPNPWEFRRDTAGVPDRFSGKSICRKNSHGDVVYDLIDYEEVRALPYDLPIVGYSVSPDFSVLNLRLWSTKESPRNFQLQRYNAGDIGQASENTSLTDVLYPNDNHEAGKRIRLKQEFLLVSASLQDIMNQYKDIYSDISQFANTVRIQINDTHPALIIPELMHLLTKENDIAWGKAWEIVRTCCAYTNHTVLKEALEEWNAERLRELLPRHHAILEKLNQEFCREIRTTFPNDEEKVRRMSMIEGGQIKMANLAIYGSHKVNGVAALHTEILKKTLFKDFNEMYPERIINITNGITQRRWLLHSNPLLSAFLEKRIGKGWIMNFEEIARIADYAKDEETQKEFLAIKRKNKEILLKMIQEDTDFHHDSGKKFSEENFLGPDALFDVQIKRFHEYKRQLMKALHLLMLYFEIKKKPQSHRIQRFAIFGGKAAPGYDVAKCLIRLIYCLSRKINTDPDVRKKLKVIMIENYNVSEAEVIIPAADLSEQISTAGMEASGTGNMKFAVNGALTIATDDGANVEMREKVTDEWWPFMFGASSGENLEMWRTHDYNPLEICANQPPLQRVITSLKDGSLVETDAEQEALMTLYRTLMEGAKPDHFFVLKDLLPYYETQKKVEELYQNPSRWAEFALHNMAGMGSFSADVSIKNYATKIWDLKPCPPDPSELEDVRKEYSEHDRCRVVNQDPTS